MRFSFQISGSIEADSITLGDSTDILETILEIIHRNWPKLVVEGLNINKSFEFPTVLVSESKIK